MEGDGRDEGWENHRERSRGGCFWLGSLFRQNAGDLPEYVDKGRRRRRAEREEERMREGHAG